MQRAQASTMDDFGSVVAKMWNLGSAVAIAGTIIGWFPYVAAFIGMCYYLLQMYESPTAQTWLHTRRVRKIAATKKYLAALEAQELKAVHRKLAKVEKEKLDAE
jgi:hypothetical protein